MLALIYFAVMKDERIAPVPISVYKAEVWRHLGFCGNIRPGSAACRVPLEEPLRGSVAARLEFSHVLGAFFAVGVVLASRRFHAEHKYKLKNLWKTCPISVCIWLFNNCLFSLGILQALYFSLILSRCRFLFRSKCYDIVYYNCKWNL